ncbi:hypothetical protein MCAP1_003584 [Malassezia caprae]|uniref:Uncharacterized protein n=1 Tax=Malassezia caprae TaxID=1381934 RepID=A0AAF0IYE5_9BASI|nr:hypothetical protein MCAP1_003584 [Malassezia caprae]
MAEPNEPLASSESNVHASNSPAKDVAHSEPLSQPAIVKEPIENVTEEDTTTFEGSYNREESGHEPNNDADKEQQFVSRSGRRIRRPTSTTTESSDEATQALNAKISQQAEEIKFLKTMYEDASNSATKTTEELGNARKQIRLLKDQLSTGIDIQRNFFMSEVVQWKQETERVKQQLLFLEQREHQLNDDIRRKAAEWDKHLEQELKDKDLEKIASRFNMPASQKSESGTIYIRARLNQRGVDVTSSKWNHKSSDNSCERATTKENAENGVTPDEAVAEEGKHRVGTNSTPDTGPVNTTESNKSAEEPNKDQYEATLSRLEKNANYHLFKRGIKPMWEDPANANDDDDLVTGAVCSLRAKGDRITIWTRRKEPIDELNQLATSLLKLLELEDQPGIQLEFGVNSGSKEPGYIKQHFAGKQPESDASVPVSHEPALESWLESDYTLHPTDHMRYMAQRKAKKDEKGAA